MPVDSRIALAGQPPVIPELDWNKTFLTLGQLKYLNAEAQALQAKTGREQALFEGTRAGTGLLSSLRTPAAPAPVPPGVQAGSPPGGPPFDEATLAALPQGGSTPPPGAALPTAATAPAPGPRPGAPARRLDILDPDVQAELYRIGGPAAPALLKEALEAKTAGLKYAQDSLVHRTNQFETALRTLDVIPPTREGYAAWHLMQATHLPPEVMTKFPPPAQFTPDLIPKMKASGLTLLDQRQKAIDEGKLSVEQANADTQRILAEIDKARLGPLTTQANAAATQAETQRRLQERPYTMGTGYGRDPRSPEPTVVGPQAGAPGAPRSPEGLGQGNALSREFADGSKDFIAATTAYNQTVPLLKDKTNTSDLMALRGFQKLSELGQAIGVFGGKQTEALGNLPEQIMGEISRLTTDKGATIAGPLREKMAATAKKLHALHIDQHLEFRDHLRAKAKAQGLPIDEVAPNRLTTSGSGGTAISQAKFKAYLAAHPGVTRGQAILDLADNGYYVRGGPE